MNISASSATWEIEVANTTFICAISQSSAHKEGWIRRGSLDLRYLETFKTLTYLLVFLFYTKRDKEFTDRYSTGQRFSPCVHFLLVLLP